MKNLVKDVKQIFLKLTLILFLLTVTSLRAEDEQTWKINLKDAEIRAFITQVADITEKSFVIDPRVKGKVTVISHSSLYLSLALLKIAILANITKYKYELFVFKLFSTFHVIFSCRC